MQRVSLIILCIFHVSVAFGQVGGQRSYDFMNIPYNPRVVGMGGLNVSTSFEDVNLVISNPALSSDSLSGMVSFNYLSYLADINVLSTVYQHDFGKSGHWFIGVNHVSYGNFESFDDTGISLGEFDAGETFVTVGRGHQLDNFSLGASLKLINSSIAGFSSTALAVDLGGAFIHPKGNFTAGLVFKNIGFVLSDYSESQNSQLPFDVQLGASLKPKHMPFRFTFTAYNLYKGDIAFFDPNSADQEEEPGTFDKVMRHFVVATELLLSKNVNFRLGYNHLIRQELKLEDKAAGAGLSFGLMFRIKAFEFAYSRGGYHAAGGSNSFSVTANTNLFLKRRNF